MLSCVSGDITAFTGGKSDRHFYYLKVYEIQTIHFTHHDYQGPDNHRPKLPHHQNS